MLRSLQFQSCILLPIPVGARPGVAYVPLHEVYVVVPGQTGILWGPLATMFWHGLDHFVDEFLWN